MASRIRLSKSERQRLVLEHAKHLISLAEREFPNDESLSHHYAGEIMKSAARVNLRLPSFIKRRICRKCHHFLMPGRNARVRTAKGHVVITCLDCGQIHRFGYLREQKARRKGGASSSKQKK